ncbi:MAG: hypothetical protein QM612_11735 [Thermomonas sp.]|uniref:HVO_A0114 family putative DNA-binding protein n=1 Tax=Thermomonas sp. TaxID=1971895 RepID=UPI0039E4DC62
MNTIVLEVMPPDEAMARLQASIAAGKFPKQAHRTFISAESMARTLTPLRWTMLQTMTGAGPLGVRELARRLGRDVRALRCHARHLAVADTDQPIVARVLIGQIRDALAQLRFRFLHVTACSGQTSLQQADFTGSI